MAMIFKNKSRTVLRAGIILSMLLLCASLSGQTTQVTYPANTTLKAKVVIPGGDMTIRKIFTLIEEQKGVLFGYVTQDLDDTQVVRLRGGEYVLSQLLDWLLSDLALKYSVSGQHIIIRRDDFPHADAAMTDYGGHESVLPRAAVKTNLLYDMTATVNLGVEIGIAPNWSVELPVNYNMWKLGGKDSHLIHFGIQPEIRYWTCSRFDGWFFGLHGHYAAFNVGAWPEWSIISANMRQNRYEGRLYGGGLSTGYSWILKRRWSMEFTAGLGYAHIIYDKYPCAECGTSMQRSSRDYIGPTKIGLSLIYMFR